MELQDLWYNIYLLVFPKFFPNDPTGTTQDVADILYSQADIIQRDAEARLDPNDTTHWAKFVGNCLSLDEVDRLIIYRNVITKLSTSTCENCGSKKDSLE